MTAEISYHDTRDGLTLLRRRWPAVGDTRATVVIVHGLNEHSGRYEHVGRRLAHDGFEVVCDDQRSFGRSGGATRSYIDRFDSFLDDLEDHLADVRSGSEPGAVLGHSMGGLIAAAYAVSDRPQPDAYVLTAPLLGVEVPSWQQRLAGVASRLAPRRAMPGSIDSSTLSRDPAVQWAYDDDPLVQTKVSARLAHEMFGAVDRTLAQLAAINTPMLVLHGADDRLVPARFSAPLGSVDGVRRELLPGLRHEILNEPEQDEVIDRIAQWLTATLA